MCWNKISGGIGWGPAGQYHDFWRRRKLADILKTDPDIMFRFCFCHIYIYIKEYKLEHLQFWNRNEVHSLASCKSQICIRSIFYIKILQNEFTIVKSNVQFHVCKNCGSRQDVNNLNVFQTKQVLAEFRLFLTHLAPYSPKLRKYKHYLIAIRKEMHHQHSYQFN